MDRGNLVCGEVLVVNDLQAISRRCFVVREQAEGVDHVAPGQLLVADFVVAAMAVDQPVQLEEINVDLTDFGLGVEVGAPLLVVRAKFGEEVDVLGGVLNEVGGLGNHCDASSRDGGAMNALRRDTLGANGRFAVDGADVAPTDRSAATSMFTRNATRTFGGWSRAARIAVLQLRQRRTDRFFS